MEEVDRIFARPRLYDEGAGVNGFTEMLAEFEKLLPVDEKTMKYMEILIKKAFREELLPWADQALLLQCNWVHSKELSLYMLEAALACTNESAADDWSGDEDEDGRCVKTWFYLEKHKFLKDKYNDRVYDIDSGLEIGQYIEGDDIIDFHDEDDRVRESDSDSDEGNTY